MFIKITFSSWSSKLHMSGFAIILDKGNAKKTILFLKKNWTTKHVISGKIHSTVLPTQNAG